MLTAQRWKEEIFAAQTFDVMETAAASMECAGAMWDSVGHPVTLRSSVRQGARDMVSVSGALASVTSIGRETSVIKRMGILLARHRS